MWLQLALTGLCVAVIPFCIVFLSKEKNKHRKLIAVSVALTFELIMFGAFTRLTDSGLGCRDCPATRSGDDTKSVDRNGSPLSGNECWCTDLCAGTACLDA